jgi:hypothetical protein
MFVIKNNMATNIYIILQFHKDNTFLKEIYYKKNHITGEYANVTCTNFDKNIEKFNSKYIKAKNLNFTVMNSNLFSPRSYFRWLISDKSKYEKSKGIVIKMSFLTDNFPCSEFDELCTYDEIINKIKNFSNIEYLYFNINYSKFYHNKLYFNEINNNEISEFPLYLV